MSRKEILDALKVGGLYNSPIRKDHPLWIQAIEIYKTESGDKEVSLECGGCVKKIKNWLERE